MSTIRYYIPDLKGSNSYTIREFSELNEKVKEQIAQDVATLKHYQSLTMVSDRKMFKHNNGSYLAKKAMNVGDEEIENTFVIITTDSGQEFQYPKDVFYLLDIMEHASSNGTYDYSKVVEELSIRSTRTIRINLMDENFSIEYLLEQIAKFLAQLLETFTSSYNSCPSISPRFFEPENSDISEKEQDVDQNQVKHEC